MADKGRSASPIPVDPCVQGLVDGRSHLLVTPPAWSDRTDRKEWPKTRHNPDKPINF